MMGMLLSLLLLAVNCPKCPPGKIKVAVFELSGTGVEKELLTTVSDLLRIDMGDCGEYIVMSKADMPDSSLFVNGGTEEVSKICEKIGASYAVTGNIVKLGNKLIISVALINRWEKIRIFEDKITASSIEDLDATVKRLALALCQQKKSKGSVNVENVTEDEAKPKLRRETYSTFGVIVGYFFPLENSLGKYAQTTDIFSNTVTPKGDLTSIPGWGVYYIYETARYMGQAAGSWYYKDATSRFANLEFSGYRFLSLGDISPFIGGGLGVAFFGNKLTGIDSTYGYYRPITESFDGMTASAGIGVEFFRTYDFHFIFSANYNIIFTDGNPNGPSIRFGMTYKKKSGGCF
ncbi:MAG: hypothetical protein PHX21_04660 [bacterium]|nr:hypothetical protein [bacterium]